MKDFWQLGVILIVSEDDNLYAGLIASVVVFNNDLLRNIKGIRISEDLFDDLGDTSDYAFAHAAESRDTISSNQALITRPFDYGAAITYPFIQSNWQRTRFSDGMLYGVWYGALDIETTIHESAFHWKRFVLDSFPSETVEVIADRRVISARCSGILVSLVGKEKKWPALIDQGNYSFTNV